jgi:hypothetical protein
MRMYSHWNGILWFVGGNYSSQQKLVETSKQRVAVTMLQTKYPRVKARILVPRTSQIRWRGLKQEIVHF